MNLSDFQNKENHPEKIGVLIPTYNNEKTLARVLDGVRKQTSDIIVVNDGSTDTTSEILQNYPQLTVVHFPENKGKGEALRRGFKIARELGWDYVITIDSDGQHFPEEIPRFTEEITKNPKTILIGSRKMDAEGIPKKSSFGNKISTFWFWVETGISLSDTQSGFRLYPLTLLPKKYFTSKFEFEIEVLVRSAWEGVQIKNIPIGVLYDEKERVSHFRPITDFLRISALNTCLVTWLLLYIIPRNLYRKFTKKGFKTFFFEDVLKSQESPQKKSLAIALGVFIGIAPLWGFQTVSVLFLASVFRLNKVISFTFSNISLPPFIPLIIFLSLMLGSIFYGEAIDFADLDTISLEQLKNHSLQYLIGSLLLATLTACIFGLFSFFILNTFAKKIKNKN